MIFCIFIGLCNHQCNFRDISITSERSPVPSAITPRSHSPPDIGNQLVYFLSMWICLFWKLHINAILQSMIFGLASFT